MSTTTAKTNAKTKRRVRCRTRIGPRSAGRLMTPEQFDALRPEQFVGRNRYELINGVLVVTPPVSAGEADPNDDLGHMLRTYQETHPQGAVLDRTLPERTVPATAQRRRADRVIWTGLGRVPDEENDIPSIVIEFVSERRSDAVRDYEAKRDEYLAVGVKEYWVIDRFRRMMTVYRKGLSGPTCDVVTEPQAYRTDLLPGFVLPLSRLLAKADDWSRARRSRRTRGQNPPTGGTNG
ncbi:MAG: Uma2 family endonuclease [Isosphaerales bacterium]